MATQVIAGSTALEFLVRPLDEDDNVLTGTITDGNISMWNSGTALGFIAVSALVSGVGYRVTITFDEPLVAGTWMSFFVPIVIGDDTPVDQHDFFVVESNEEILTAILGVTGVVESPSCGLNLKAYVGESKTFVVNTVDSLGDPVDLSSANLTITIEDKLKRNLIVIATGDITKTSTTISFVSPPSVNAFEFNGYWSLRYTTSNEVILRGSYEVQYAATP